MTAPKRPVRVAVIGAGQMGSNHARAYQGLKGVELVAVVDHDKSSADRLASLYDCLASTEIESLKGRVDAATVAVPSTLHCEVGTRVMAMGIHCLIEKPLATDEAEVKTLIAAAETHGTNLLVGHIERFNPAVAQLKAILGDGHDLLALDARRMSAVSSRVTDIDVVSDLMIHDLDIALDLFGEPVVDVVARGVIRGGSSGEDYVTAVLQFAGGAIATLTASRITQNQIRSLELTTDQRFFKLDYSAQELLIYRQGRIGSLADGEPDGNRYVLDVGTERVFVRRIEPLVAELEHFIGVVRGNTDVLITAHHALEVTRLASRIRDEVRSRSE